MRGLYPLLKIVIFQIHASSDRISCIPQNPANTQNLNQQYGLKCTPSYRYCSTQSIRARRLLPLYVKAVITPNEVIAAQPNFPKSAQPVHRYREGLYLHAVEFRSASQ
jgi:hypothetical protein